MATGYIKLWRQLGAKGVHSDGPVSQLLLWALPRLARFPVDKLAAGRGHVHLEPGQIDFSRSELAGTLGLTEKQVRGAIERLARVVDLRIEGRTEGRNYSVLTFVNFMAWQEASTPEGPAKGPSQGQPRANPGPTSTPKPAPDGPFRAPEKERREEGEKKKRPAPAEPAQAERLCRMIVQALRERDPKAKEPAPAAWASWLYEMDNVVRLDGRTWPEAERVLRWALADPFWRQNIRSAPTFRQRFERLRDGWLDSQRKEGGYKGRRDDDEQARRAKRAEARAPSPGAPGNLTNAREVLQGILAGLGVPKEDER